LCSINIIVFTSRCYNNVIFIPRISLYRHYHQNSEHTNSRCIPKYESESWSSQLTEIYNQNYLLCNIHRILYNLANSCFYNEFIIKNFDSDIRNIDDIKQRIKEFISDKKINNYMNGFDKKYLKYKQKYLKLKNKLNL